jgi:hypothetical protein
MFWVFFHLDTAETFAPESTAQKDDLDDLDKEAIDLVNWSRNLSTEQTYYEEMNEETCIS